MVDSLPPPFASGSASHRNLRKGLLSASELSPLEEQVNEGESFPDLVCVIRFPPSIAAILRKRLNENFRQGCHNNEISGRGPLGLSITPTPKEDYRVFEVDVDILDEQEIEIIKKWQGQSFDISDFKPLPLNLITTKSHKTDTRPKMKPNFPPKATKAKPDNENIIPDHIIPETPPLNIAGTVRLLGMLSELPTLLEAYKSLDFNSMVKAANISQILITFFPKDEHLHFPCQISKPSGPDPIHHCVERVQAAIEKNSGNATPIIQNPDFFLMDSLSHDLVNDMNKLNAPRCPWLWPSGITAPTHLLRERRCRDIDVFSRSEIGLAEIEMLSILRRGRQEYAHIELASVVEGYLQQEALRKDTSITGANQIIHPAPEIRITYIVPEAVTDVFDDPPSDFSDEMFDDEPTAFGEMQFLEDGGGGLGGKKRKDKKAISEVSVAPGGSDIGASLEEEFQELAQVQSRRELAEALDAELEAEFYSGAMVADSVGSSMVEEDYEIGAGMGITSMRKIDKDLVKKQQKKKQATRKPD